MEIFNRHINNESTPSLSSEEVERMIRDNTMTPDQLGVYLRERDRREQLLIDEQQSLRRVAFADHMVPFAMNRRALEEFMPRVFQRAATTGHPVTRLMLDGDYFKDVNDNWGHEAGDKLIFLLDYAIHLSLRESDFAVRFGGDEFTIVLPDTDMKGGVTLARRLSTNYAYLQLELAAGRGIDNPELEADFPLSLPPQTVSIGLATLSDNSLLPHQLAGAADRAMYRAKHMRHLEQRFSEFGLIKQLTSKIAVYNLEEIEVVNPHPATIFPRLTQEYSEGGLLVVNEGRNLPSLSLQPS